MMRFLAVAIGIVLCLLVPAGCSSKKIIPGAAYSLSIITKGNDGKLAPQGPVTQVGGAAVESVQQVTHEGQTLSVLVRKTQYGKATFEVTFPDKSTQMIQVKAGEPKNVLPKGQKIGVRIELQESH
jgi:hypothetical protein